MTLTDYLRRFDRHRRVTVVGPMLSAPPAVDVDAPVVWVDGGADYRGDGDGFAVGDGDSCTGALDQTLDADKDFSDLAFVLRNLPANFNQVVLLGFLGGRRDHELFNFGEAHNFLTKASATVKFDDAVVGYAAGRWRFTVDGAFSLAVLSATTLTLTGECKYKITTPTVVAPLSSFGLSNRGFGEVSVTADAPFFILQTDL